MKNKLFILKTQLTLFLFFFVLMQLSAQQATWIWYPGDYDIWLANKMQNRRTERGTFMPPFWKMDSHYVLVQFSKKYELAAPEDIDIAVEGSYNVKLDGKVMSGEPRKLSLPAGNHSLAIQVYNQQNVPAIFVKGKMLVSDNSWNATLVEKSQIDESDKAASWNFDSPEALPSVFRLNTQPKRANKAETNGQTTLVDFGCETFGYLKFHGLNGNGKLRVYYGESREEALAKETCELIDEFDIANVQKNDFTNPQSKAYRYVQVVRDAGVTFDSISMLYEYLPVAVRGKFQCSDSEINQIYEVAKYTFQLNTREFFIDGIKRDRWIWSGDAYQSYLMNYYLFFDKNTVTRTMAALRGKDPVANHINTIMDYTFFWFLGIYDYYQYTGDKTFIKSYYPRMVSLMDYCLSRRNANGMMEGRTGDWVYVDWASMDKKGELSFEQILFCRSLETMVLCANLANDADGAQKYNQLATDLRAKLLPAFWSDSKKALVNNRVNGTQITQVTRYSNMFAIFFGYFDADKMQMVKKSVLLNDSVQKIITPYMRFYELEALCAMGEQNYVLKEIKNYWGGMLNAGATTFWEKFDPSESGTQHLAMYDRPFGRSLCHAWGASPIYLLGKYYLGVKPTLPGYQTYTIEPVLGGLQWIDGIVPTPDGDISVYCSTRQIKVKSASGTGTLHFQSLSKPKCNSGNFKEINNQTYELTIEKGVEYEVTYKSLSNK